MEKNNESQQLNQPVDFEIEEVGNDKPVEKNQPVDFTIELVEDDKKIKVQSEEETPISNVIQPAKEKTPWWKRNKTENPKKDSKNILPTLNSSIFSKIKSGAKAIKKGITSGINKFLEKNAWYTFRENKIAESAQQLAVGRKELETGRQELEAAKQALEAGRKALEAGRKALEAESIRMREDGESALEGERQKLRKQLAAEREKLEGDKKELEDAQQQLATAQQQLADEQQQLATAQQQLADEQQQFLEKRSKELGFNEPVPEIRVKAEEYMCERFRSLYKQLTEYYAKYLGKDSKVQFDPKEKKDALARLRGRLIAELSLLSGILDNNESFIFRFEGESEISFEKLKKRITRERVGLFEEYKWTIESEAKEEMEKQYKEGIEEMIKLGVYLGGDFTIKKIGTSEILRQLLQSGSDRDRGIKVNEEWPIFGYNYNCIKAADGIRREKTERIIHPGHDDISKAVGETISFIEENGDGLEI